MQSPNFRSSRGFTLVEIMLVVTIVGILVGISIPGYDWVVQRGRRAEGIAALSAAAQQLERFFTNANTYTTVNATAGVPAQSENGKYIIAITPGPTPNGIADSFILTATPVGWTDSRCGSLTLTSTGTRGISGGTATVPDCWR